MLQVSIGPHYTAVALPQLHMIMHRLTLRLVLPDCKVLI